MKSILSLLGLLSLVLSTEAFADNRERGHAEDRDHRDEHSKDKDHKSFTVDKREGSIPLTVKFNSSGIPSAKNFYWTFGDEQTLATTNAIVSHTYNQAGSYTARLKYSVKNNDKDRNQGKGKDKNDRDDKYNELKDGGWVVIKVLKPANLPPVASLNCTTNNLLTACNALSTYDPEGQPLAYSFNYGDGFIESNTSGISSHAYALAGLYTVSLTVTDVGDLTSSVSTQVQAVRPPNVIPFAALNCISTKPRYLECDSIGSTDSDGTIVSYKYLFDDGTVESSASTGKIVHNFSNGGNHPVTLAVIDNDGGANHIDKNVPVLENTIPVADFNCLSNKPYQVTCQSISSDPDAPNDSIVEYSWNLDGQTINSSSGISLEYDFHKAGEFPITLTVKDSFLGVGTITKSINVIDNIPPVASFNCSNTGVQSVHCESTSTDSDGQIASAAWSLDDGTKLTGTSIDHSFSSGGDHSISLTVTDNLGATNSLENGTPTISNLLPTAEIFASTLTGVFPLAVNFEARNVSDSDGTVESISWAFSDGGTAVGVNVSHTFTSVGTFKATLIVRDNLGGVTSKSVDIATLVPLKVAPVVGFKYFENGTTTIELRSTITKTQFDIDHAFYTVDGTQIVPVAEFYSGTRTLVNLNTFGQHTISLTAVDVRGQTTSTTFQFGLLKDPSTLKPISDFTVKQSSVRTAFFNFNKSFNPDIRFGIKNYHIEYGDGTSEDITDDTFATHTYLNSGTYNVNLVVISSQGNGTVRSLTTKSVTVSDQDVPVINPVAAFAYQLNSWALNVTFENEKSGTPNGSIISYLWDFGDGTTATGPRVAHFYDPGSYLVTLTVTDSAGLKNFQTQHVTITQVGSDLVANIDCGISTAQKQICNVTALDKFNEISSVSVNWGDGTTSDLNEPVEPAQGLYKVSKKFFTNGIQTIGLHVTTARGETKTVSTTKEVILSAPVAKINCTTDNLRAICNSGGSSDPTDAGIESFTYNFGIGLPVTTSSGYLVNTYALDGTYNVTLTVKSKSGLSSTAVTQVIVKNANPIASINCYTTNMLVSCNSLGSFDKELENLTYEFDFSDGYIESSTTGFSTHAYTDPGLYTVTLKVTDTAGNSGFKSMQVQPVLPPNQLPFASLNCNSDAPYIGRCSVTAQDPDGALVSFKYNWDDNSEETHATSEPVFHIFSTGGSHQVVLTITDNDGGASSITQTFNVQENHPPLAYINCYNFGAQSIRCISQSQELDMNDVITEYKWNLGNGTVITSMVPSIDYTYAASSTYTVTLQVKDSMGATSSASQSITTIENQAPFASIDCQNSGLQTVSCHTFSYDSDGSIANIHWALDDGFVFNGNSFTHTFASGEAHSATITITDNLGKTATATQDLNVLVNKLPSFEISIDNVSGILPFVAHFEAQKVVDLDGSIASYKWIFGDGTFSDQAIVDHTFTTAGIYNVKLQVTDNDGGMTERSVTVRTSAPSNLIINTDKDNGVANLNVHFDANGSSDPDGEIIKYEWFYQGKKFAEGVETDYEFDISGPQKVELVATNNFGIKTHIGKTINVKMPAIYLDGIIDDIAFVDRQYSTKLNLIIQPSIIKENLTYQFEDAPEGVVFDPETDNFTWTPNKNEIGEVNFRLLVTDGVLSFYRKFNIRIQDLTPIATISSTPSGGVFTIQNPDSVFNKAQLIAPENIASYTLNIFESKGIDGSSLKVETSSFLREPITVNFNQAIQISQRVQKWDADLNNSLNALTPNILKLDGKRLSACADDMKDFEISLDATPELKQKKYNELSGFGSNQVWLHTDYDEKNTKVKAFKDALGSISPLINNADIYVTDDTLFSELAGSGGLHPVFDKKTLLINLNGLAFGKTLPYIKFLILHEYNHILQSRARGCIPVEEMKNEPSGMLNIVEGSADYNALFALNETDRGEVLKGIDFIFPARSLADSFLKEGLFRMTSLDDFDLRFPYRTRLYWDYLKVNWLQFFKNYGDDQLIPLQPPKILRDNSDIVRIMKKTSGTDLSEALLNLTDGVSNFNAPINGQLTTLVKNNSSIFDGWTQAELNNSISVTEDEFEIKAFSGVSKNFNVKEFAHLNFNDVPPDMIKISFSIIGSTPNEPLKINARSNGNTIDSRFQRNFGTSTISNEVTGIRNFSAANEPTSQVSLNEKIYFSIVNPSSIDTKVKFKVSISCGGNCPGNNLSFTSSDRRTFKFKLSSNSSISGLSYKWQFGDGVTSTTTTSEVTHTYASNLPGGAYTVSVQTYNNTGYSTNATASILVRTIYHYEVWAQCQWTAKYGYCYYSFCTPEQIEDRTIINTGLQWTTVYYYDSTNKLLRTQFIAETNNLAPYTAFFVDENDITGQTKISVEAGTACPGGKDATPPQTRLIQ
ncbi:MAG: PKD domain-containing protein [Bacteriovorax sp.]|jgi:PKD repeat protein